MIETRFKDTEIGKIPEEWEVSKFRDVLVNFSTGATPYRGISRYYRGHIKWITSGELNNNVVTETLEHISNEALVKTNLKIVPVGTFLMAITGLEAEGTRGKCAIVGAPAATNQSCLALNGTNKVITEYLFWFYIFRSDLLAFKYCQGTKQQSYTAEIVKNLPICYPSSLEEQRRIADALSKVDSLIASLDKLIAKKQAIKRGAMQELLTGKKRLSGLKVHNKELQKAETRFKDTEIGRIPENWDVIPLGSIGEPFMCKRIMKWQTNNKGGIPFYKIGTFGRKPDAYIDVNTFEYYKYHFNYPNKGDILISAAGTIGRTVIFDGEPAYFQDSNIVWIDNNQESILNSFLFYYYKIVKWNTENGGIVTRLYNENLKATLIAVPPLPEQRAIAHVLSSMDAEIAALERKRDKFRQVKQGMMQDLLTGRIRLTDN